MIFEAQDKLGPIQVSDLTVHIHRLGVKLAAEGGTHLPHTSRFQLKRNGKLKSVEATQRRYAA